MKRAVSLALVALSLAFSAATSAQEAPGSAACKLEARLRGPIFDTEKRSLEPGLSETLDLLAKQFLANCEGKLLVIESHAVELPTPDLNLRLSELRALGVRYELARRGIPEARMLAVGMGDSSPLDPTKGPDSLNLNRRITFRSVE